jgi:phospholipid/cholesterol/gamma-HCH transport system substrate-binding protein
MITRFVRIQLVAFVVVSMLAITYLGIKYVRLGSLVGQGGYTVKMQLAESGGIFSNAEVTYRGVTIGRVGELRLIPDGVEVDLNIDHGSPRVPADLQAVVANRSAVGEQYVDLRPNTSAGPFLTENSVIPKDRTATPLPVDTVLLNLDRLVSSVPLDSLRIVVDELYAAVNGTGPQLQTIMDATTALTGTATEHLPQTVDLLRDGRVVLDTVNDQSSAIQSFSRDLRLLSEQLVASDPDLRALIAAGPPVSAELSALLRDVGPGLSDLMADVLLINTEVLLPRQDSIKIPLIAYPIVAAGGYSVLSPDGSAHLSLAINMFDPPPCFNGYQGTPKREGVDTEPEPLNVAANCAEPLGSPVAVRGAKVGYPYVDGRPGAVPAWVCEKYREAAVNFRVDCDNPSTPSPGTDGSGTGSAPPEAVRLPGLLGAPDGGGAIELLTLLLAGGGQ